MEAQKIEKFESLLERVQAGLEKVKTDRKPIGLYEPIQYTLEAGGKRIRPVFALMACQIWGENAEKAIYPALGLEYFHNFTLLHDDVMDCADMRRGRPTVHKKWDQNTAILSGDAMFTLSCMLAAKGEESCLKEVITAFHNIALGICEGQQYDMEFETRDEVSMAEYMEMIRLKTSVLFAGALEIGALTAGAKKDGVEKMYAIGEKLGIAFQLQDDWLDLYGEEAKFGKKIGSDIREGKKTFLYLKALKLLPVEEANKLRKIFLVKNLASAQGLGSAQGLEDKIKEVKNIYESVDMRNVCLHEIKKWYEQAKNEIGTLSSMGANEQATAVFSDFTQDLMGRDF